jgi:16S rRNA processing protein RimM
MPAGSPDRLVCVAQIGAAHGVRGEVRLHSFTEEPASVVEYGLLDSEDGRRFQIANARPAKDALIVRFEGVNDRNAAEALRNIKLYVPRARLGETGEDEFFHADLIGMTAVDRNGAAMGTVSAVHNFGAGDLLEITQPDGGEPLLLPFTKACVPRVDVAGRAVMIDVPVEASVDPVGDIPPLQGED